LRRRTSRSPQKPLVSVLTPTIEGRENFLAECEASVAAQTFRRYEHLILLDEERVGCAKTMNALAESSEADWLFILADDDLLLPRCLELHLQAGLADIIYGVPLVWGEDATQFCAGFPNVPATALISREFWNRLGGYSPDCGAAEDNEFYRRSELRGARTLRIESGPTWIYRFHGGNKSRF
jgi:glycosyltransferase involved in cell wall biosynthesis